MIKLELSKKEKQLIVKVVDIQLESLSKIVCENTHVDLTMFCLENQTSMAELRKSAIKNMMQFDAVKNDPTTLLSLDTDNLQIVRHILQSWVKDKKLKRAKSTVWRKLSQFSNMVQLYHPN